MTLTDNGNGTIAAAPTYTKGDQTAESAAFTNTYEAKSVSVSIPVTKILDVPESLTGPSDITGAFTFTLKPNDDSFPMPAAGGEVVTNPAKDGGTANFGDIVFTAPGDYTYTVTESDTNRGGVPGVKDDLISAKTVNVKVTDDGNGQLTAVSSSTTDSSLTFTNTYSAKETSATISVNKALAGANLAPGQFSFMLTAKDNAPMPSHDTVTNGANGDIVFGGITYTTPGEYHYTVAEIYTAKAGYTYDDSTINVTVTVKDHGDGTMTAETTYGKQTSFNNSYSASGSIQLSASKSLSGATIAADQFSFKLKDKDGKVLQTKTNDASGAVTFDAIKYSVEDLKTSATNEATRVNVAATVGGSEAKPVSVQLYANGVASGEAIKDVTTDTYDFGEQAKSDAAGKAITYTVSVDGAEPIETTTTDVDAGSKTSYVNERTFTYTISEVNDNQSGYTYDDKVVTVTVTVKNDGKGNLTATASYDKSAEFSNSYHASGSTGEGDLGGKKVSNGTVADGQFSFELIDEQGNVLQTVKNAADGSFSFEPLSYDETQVGTHTYSIVEVNDGQVGYTYDTHVATATVNVTDNGDGTLAVTTSYGETSREFNNPYKALGTSTQLQAKKVLVGRDLAAGEFDFQLTDAAGTTYTAQNAADGTITFPYVSFDEPGTYTFTASEVAGSEANVTYDGGTFTYTVVVEDVNGQLAVTSVTTNGSADVPTFTNTYTEPVVEKTVVKVPDTGDNSGVGVLAALVAGAAAVAAGSIARRRDQD